MTADHQCFCELAPLYVLDVLDEDQRQWVDRQVANFPELAAELEYYSTTTSAIAYSAPLLPLAGNLKDRLFDRLELDPITPPPSIEIPAFLAMRGAELQWHPHPHAPQARVALLHQDPVRRTRTGLFQAEAGLYYPPHRHVQVEEIYMLSGDLIVADQVYGAGDYIRSEPGSVHPPITSTQGCMFFFHASMDDEYPQPESLVTA